MITPWLNIPKINENVLTIWSLGYISQGKFLGLI